MSVFEKLSDASVWGDYLAYKINGRHLTRSEESDLRKYIDNREYLPVLETVVNGERLPIPEKKLIRKMRTDKKRTVYIYPRAFNYVLKLMTFLLLREYDGCFSDTLYSFRVKTGVNKAMRNIMSVPGLADKYTYKVDISNYFNSIPVERMLKKLKELTADNDREIFELLQRLLISDEVLDGDRLVHESKGVMAGTPFAVFLANVYLRDMDNTLAGDGKATGSADENDGVKGADNRLPDVIYARYSDDIIVIADTAGARDEAAGLVRRILAENGLTVNPSKEQYSSPGEPWSFLGIGYENGTIDISDVSKDKLKSKMRRKARAIKRWQVRKGASREQAVKAYIRAMNRKFFDPDSSHELTWSRWYFPVINTDRTLHELDAYMQHWIRYLATDGHKKSSYKYKYEDMKKLGYISLVHEYWQQQTFSKAGLFSQKASDIRP